MNPTLPLALLTLALAGAPASRATDAASLKFDFGTGPVTAGVTRVSPDTVFRKDVGFGFEPGAALTAGRRGVASDRPFFFSARVPAEGNYRVTVTVGDAQAESTTTIKAELRRLMVEKVHTAAGQFATVSFIVNVRTPRIPAVGAIKAGTVRLKAPRETTQEAWAWDDLLTLEFNNTHPAIAALEIAPAAVPTVFLLGDSTVCDQSNEPYSSWGQSLPRWFKPDFAVANHGESGETYRDAIGERRLDKILTLMKPGDWLIMQFGHNDQKQIPSGRGGPFTTYKDEIKQTVDAVRAQGGTPVIVSSMERRNFTADGKIRPTLTDYAEAARQSATELGVAFIDLHALSISFYEALGPGRAYLAFAGTGTQRDPTHHNDYGSYELAQCIAQGIRDRQLPLARHLVDDFAGFDPAHPDDPAAFALPPSPNVTHERPLGD